MILSSDFAKKIISDSVHGPIGISKLEQAIINTRTFQRLKKIKHLGLASLVFPAAEHSRFTHSIGVMHVMTQIIEKLLEQKCKYLDDKNEIQKLRLAALLHDIGHYPLAHLGEHTFKWVDESRNKFQATEPLTATDDCSILLNAAKKHISDVVSHEKLGKLILTSHRSEISDIIKSQGYDPLEISKIFNFEHANRLYGQLMSSTMDCDRMDFLPRDSHACGTCYGRVELEYILRNVIWDEASGYICFQPKAINAIEHFILGRYFSYNITYHKTIMGFELMAKTLFFKMVMDDEFNEGEYGGIVHSYEDIEKKVIEDEHFLANFNDEYFWHYLELYDYKLGAKLDQTTKKLIKNLLIRKPLRPIYGRRVIASQGEQSDDTGFEILTKKLINNGDFKECLRQNGLSISDVSIVENKIDFEEMPYEIKYTDEIKEESRIKLVKIMTENGIKDLIGQKWSIIHILSKYQPRFARLYALVDKDSEAEKKLREVVKSICSTTSN